MQHTHKILNIATPNLHLQENLSKQLNISKILSQLLINRGIKNPKEGKIFLDTDLDSLNSPFDFLDMPKVIKRVNEAIKNKERVMVFGDYDVDGITSIALLENALQKLGLEVTHYLPHRVNEGYGLNANIMQIIKEKKIKLLITADCGTNDHKHIDELTAAGIDVVITDHHEPANSNLPKAFAIINPKVGTSGYKFRDLAGVGVVYKFCQAITNDNLWDYLDLVTLGTIADVVPLVGENRVIVKEGLNRISTTKNIGLKALIESSRIGDKKITSGFVSFILGPRLNASGRVDTAETSLRLLLSQDKKDASELARIIEAHTRQRQKIEGKIMEEAEALIEKEINFKDHKIIVIAKEDWHPGVLGIVASKIADRFYRPTIVISIKEDFCKGSGRSIKNFHLFGALSECQHLLEEFGGHSHAVGLVIVKNSIEEFKKTINKLAQEQLRLEDLLPSLEIDMELNLADLTAETIEELGRLEPFGAGNPEPLFYAKNLKLKGPPQTLGKNTLKFWVSDGATTYQAIGFGMSDLLSSLLSAENFDLVYIPRIDSWQGKGSVILEIEEIFFK